MFRLLRSTNLYTLIWYLNLTRNLSNRERHILLFQSNFGNEFNIVAAYWGKGEVRKLIKNGTLTVPTSTDYTNGVLSYFLVLATVNVNQLPPLPTNIFNSVALCIKFKDVLESSGVFPSQMITLLNTLVWLVEI